MRPSVIPSLLFRSSSLLFLLLLCFCALAIVSVQGTILAKSDIQKCTRARVRQDMRCGHKIVVELAIAAGQTFNRRIRELGKGINQCRAHKCQTFDEAGRESIVENPGFCCDCVGFSESHHRGLHPNCKRFLETGLRFIKYPYGTQHCLGFDSEWFPTYAISEGQLEFTITVQVLIGYDKLLHNLTLSPGFLATSTPDKSVIARLHGDLLSYSQFPEFPGVYLSRPPERVTINRSEWLLIDKFKYSFDGAVCDLIGTSYYAFFHQVARCTQPFNNCLRFQLQDYIDEDSSRVRKGMKPRYGMLKYGAFHFATEYGRNRFLLPLKMVTKSILTLELNADNVKFIINRSPGKILSVKVPKFEALSRDGMATVVISNIGELVAGYYIAINCSSGMKASPEMVVTLQPNNPKTVTFSLETTNDKQATVECIVRLRDSGGEITDRASTMVSVMATMYINVSRFGKENTDPAFEERGFVGNVVQKIKDLLKGGIQRMFALGKGMFRSSFGTFFAIIGTLFGGPLSIFGTKDSSCSDCGIVSFACIISNLCYGKGAILVGAILCIVGLLMCGFTKGSFTFSPLIAFDGEKGHDHHGHSKRKRNKKDPKKDPKKKKENVKETVAQEYGSVWNQPMVGFHPHK